MINNIWPLTINDQQFDEPKLTQNEYKINDTNFMHMIEKYPQIWNHIVNNQQQLSTGLQEHIHNIAEKFIQTIPNKSLVKIKLPETEWQQQKKNQFAVVEFTHCANYNDYILPFHDESNQYGCFFIDIETTVRNEQLTLYWQNEIEPDGSYEEHIWTCEDNLEILYSPTVDSDEKDYENAVLKMCLLYTKELLNDRLDEIFASADEIIKIMLVRLRGKVRIGKHGTIIAVQAIVSESQRLTIEEKVSEIVDEDANYKSIGVSYKLSRTQLFGQMRINPIFTLRIFDEAAKEMKFHRSFKDCNLYQPTATGYATSRNSLLSKTTKKYKKKTRIPKYLHAMNGSRFTFNGNKIKITTNAFQSTIKTDKGKFTIKETLGRKRNGW